MTEQHERERFEAWAKTKPRFDLELNSGNESKDVYFYQNTQDAFEGFQAARANSGWLQPNDADVVEVMARGKHEWNAGHLAQEIQEAYWSRDKQTLYSEAQAALKALSDNGYKIVKEGV